MADAHVKPEAAAKIVEASRCLRSRDAATAARAAHLYLDAIRAEPALGAAFGGEFAAAAGAWARWRLAGGGGGSGADEWPATAAALVAFAAAAPRDGAMHAVLGAAAHARGRLVEARAAYGVSASLGDAPAAECARNASAALVENWHWRMVADDARNEFFAGAVADAVAAGASTVVDVGCGTGLLSLAARAAGATRVDALERCPAMARVARETVAANGGGDDGVVTSVQETPRKPGVFRLWRPVSRSVWGRFGSFLDR